MSKWEELADKQTVEQTIEALKQNRIDAVFVENGKEAKEKVLELIPQGSEVFNQTSVTLETIGLVEELNSDRFDSVRNKLSKMDRATQGREMQRLGAAPEYTVGSVHAVTQDGKVLIASSTGSQLPSYAYGADRVIWVVGVQKIVSDVDAGIKRIYEYVLPLEDKRSQKTYGSGSAVRKLLIVNEEKKPGRITIVFVNEKLGF